MKVAFGVSSVGLGHARRSLTLARNLRGKRPDLEITWFAAEPVLAFLEKEGEKFPTVCRELKSLSSPMESGVSSGRLDSISRVARSSASLARSNYLAIKDELSNFDFLIQDEFVETLLAFMWNNTPPLPRHRVVITDYLEIQSPGTRNPVSVIVNWYANRMLWRAFAACDARIFADEIDALPKSRREQGLHSFSVIGPMLPELPRESKDSLKEKLLKDLFHDDPMNRRLLVVSVGGTATGKHLLHFIAANRAKLSAKMNCRILVLLGPRIDRSGFEKYQSDSIRYLSFSPDVLKLFKAADCVICQAGASTLNEVVALGTPCVTVPISNHFEQEANARRFSAKYRVVKLSYDQVSIDSLVAAVNQAVTVENRPIVDFSSNVVKATDLILRELDN
jgi:UDP-N-acetylglucosamine--N-acetylmuramyl-(pentapeptide) pyrophosphoryl-undecaprenol N-acetylglucosamine transferase